jgi:hypothetical protein
MPLFRDLSMLEAGEASEVAKALLEVLSKMTGS